MSASSPYRLPGAPVPEPAAIEVVTDDCEQLALGGIGRGAVTGEPIDEDDELEPSPRIERLVARAALVTGVGVAVVCIHAVAYDLLPLAILVFIVAGLAFVFHEPNTDRRASAAAPYLGDRHSAARGGQGRPGLPLKRIGPKLVLG